MTTLDKQQAGHATPKKSRDQKQKAAVASRAAVREYLNHRGSGILALPKLTFAQLDSSGLISYENSKKPLPVTIDVSALGLASRDVVDVHMRGRDVGSWGPRLYRIRFDRPTDPSPDDPIVVDIPVSRLTPGDHELGYIVIEYPDTPAESDPAPLTVDHTPPFDRVHPPAPTLPDYVVTVGEINKQVIDDNPDGLVCTFPDYAANGRQPTDSIAVYFARYPSSQLSNPIDTFPVTDALTFTLRWEDLNLLVGGSYYLFYVLIDLAGNSSKDSTPAPVTVKVVGDPVPVVAEVDLAPKPADGLIDLEDAKNPAGVHVIIPKYVNDLPDDVIELTWGTRPAVRHPVSMYLPFPLYLPVPASTIFDDYGSATGEQPTDISYFVDRNGVTTPAPTADILVDLSAPGPNPGEEEENDELKPVTVVGSDTSQPNVLLPVDYGNDATLTLELWSSPLPAPGITLTPYWGDLAHPLTPQTLTTEGAGATLTFSVPWSHIRELGNNDIPVFYTLSWPTNNNIQRSLTQLVDVRANRVVLEAPTFRKANTPMVCSDLERVSREAVIRIPGNTTYFKEFDVIRAEWQIFDSAAGTSPLGDPVVFTSKPLTPDMVSNGFNINIGPYETVVRPCARNSVDIHYFVMVAGEGEVKSQRGFTTTRFANLNGNFCEDIDSLENPDD